MREANGGMALDNPKGSSVRVSDIGRIAFGFVLLGLLAGCAAQPSRMSALNKRVYDPKLGVWSSPRLVADGDSVPRGGGSYLTGRPYMIGGRQYVPSQNGSGYSVVGTASWYGDAFHGRRTANGEIFDKRSISAAHPTLPLPSYVRVTNIKNGRSMIVRVNDRGPYHGGRVMDVSQRVAEALAFRGEGTGRVRVDFIGKAPLRGSDDDILMASLRTDGTMAQLEGIGTAEPVALADAGMPLAPPSMPALPQPIAQVAQRDTRIEDDVTVAPISTRLSVVPVPPARPFTLGGLTTPVAEPGRKKRIERVAVLASAPPSPPVRKLGHGASKPGASSGHATRKHGTLRLGRSD